MSALPPMLSPRPPEYRRESGECDQFVVSFGKSGALGVFTSNAPLSLQRGQPVLIQTSRGIEIGAVLRPATLAQARLLGAASSGALVRPITSVDDPQRGVLAGLAECIFTASRAVAEHNGFGVEILDVEVMFDGASAIVQFVGNDADTDKLATALEEHFALTIRFENLATPAEIHDHGGCDKPDCGRDAGGCTTCSTGGGCSTCGSGKTDLKEYFGHLRAKMETRIPLA